MKFVEFYEFHVPALEADEARNYMLLDALAGVAEAPTRGFRGWTFGPPGACAIRPMQDWAIMLGDLTQDQCRRLADDADALDYLGVMGPDEGPDWFAARAQELGGLFQEPLRYRAHVLEGVTQSPPVVGTARTVTSQEAALFAAWMLAYTREALPRDPIPDAALLERWAGEGDYLFWTVDGEPVSVAGIVCRTKNGAGITGVYTPPDMRGHGYAAAVTAAAAKRIFDEGRSQVFLMANIDNSPAERCYAKIGFKPVAGFTYYWRKLA